MKRLFVTLGLLLLTAAPAPAQFYGSGFGGGFAYRGHHTFLRGRFGFTYYSGFYAAPIVPFYFGPPAFGVGPGFGNPFFLPPAGFDGNVLPAANLVPPPPVVNRNPNLEKPLVKAGDFLVITPKSAGQRAQGPGTISPMVDRVAAPPERPQPPRFLFDPFADRKTIGPTEFVEADAALEAGRQVKQAREAFARGEYGEAVEHLDRANRVTATGDAWFLKGQAQFAAGQYADAVTSIQAGLKLDSAWPTSGFNPRQLTGADRFAAQVADLKAALAGRPNETTLQFLLAYQLWLGGDRDEAKKLFRQLKERLKDTSTIELFLK